MVAFMVNLELYRVFYTVAKCGSLTKAAEELYRVMGQVFVPKQGWSYAIISPHDDFETLFGRKADKRRKLYNGMLKCQLYMYYK